jgi:hypothetical protein
MLPTRRDQLQHSDRLYQCFCLVLKSGKQGTVYFFAYSVLQLENPNRAPRAQRTTRVIPVKFVTKDLDDSPKSVREVRKHIQGRGVTYWGVTNVICVREDS